MPRTATGPERARVQALAAAVFLRVYVQNGSGSYVEYGAVNSADYRLSASVASATDQVSDTATIVLRSGKGALSIAPAMNGATVNATTRAIDARRGARVDVATIAPGATPAAGDWKRIFDGSVSKIAMQNGGETITLACVDLMDAVLRASFPATTWFGDGSVALETVIQSMLTTAMAGGAPTLVTPVSPAWAPARIDVVRGSSVWSAISALCDQIGWLVRYRWNGNTPELRLFGPNRSASSADWTLVGGEIKSLQSFDYDGDAVRNTIEVGYRNASGALSTYTATDSASVTAYGTQKLIVREAAGSQITDATKAQRMADAILADTKVPPLSHAWDSNHPEWMVECGDVIDVPPNGVTHDATQRLAVWAVTHTFADGGGSSSVLLRGAPASRGRGWLDLGVPDGATAPGRIEVVGATQSGSGYVLRFRAYSATGAQLTAAADCEASVTQTPAGSSPTTSALAVSWDAGNAWHTTASVARAFNDAYRIDLSVIAKGTTARVTVPVPVPTYTILSTGGAPRFASCTINIATPVSGTAGADVELRFTTSDAPSGATYGAVVNVGSSIKTLNGIATGEVIATGRPIASGTGGPYINSYTINGTVKMFDASGNVLAERVIPTTVYYGA